CRHNSAPASPTTGRQPGGVFVLWGRLAEQYFALKLGQDVEAVGPLPVSIARLQIYRPVLHRQTVEETLPCEQQLEAFFSAPDPYVAVTKQRQYQRLLFKVAGLNAIVKSIVQANPRS